MDSQKNKQDYANFIMNNKCPYCGLRLGNFIKQEQNNAEFKNCSRCGRVWEIIGGSPNGFPCICE